MSFTQGHAARRIQRERWVRPSTPEDAQEIIALMRGARLQPHVALEQLKWKYWDDRPDWPGSRSFVMTDGRELLAHVALMPGILRWGSDELRIAHPIDWAGRREAVGAGVRVMKHVGEMTDCLLAVGGSRDTLRIMPLMGYRPRGEMTGYVRTLSPFRILQRPSRSRWKRPARVVRSLIWSCSAPSADLRGWQVRRMHPDELARAAVPFPAPPKKLAVLARSPALLRHALACPIVPTELHVLEREGQIGGYFLLSYAPGQARLADVWMATGDRADWRAAVYAAVARARRRGRIAELITWSSDPVLAQVLRECGFRARLTLPIYLRPSSGAQTLPQETLRVQMLDNDAYYLHFGGNELWA